jgi:hypothetical protein
VKRILICIAAIIVASEAVQASTIIACGQNTLNSCYQSYLPTFNAQLDWDSVLSTSPTSYIAPPINGNSYPATWYASGYMNVSISGSSLIRADDYALVHTGMGWASIPCCAVPHAFTGGFDSAPDTNYPGYTPGSFGEGLLGSYNAGSFVIGSTLALSSFGFRIASITDQNFTVTIDLFGSTNGTGSYQQLTVSSALGGGAISGGGNCAGLSTLGSNGNPTPCNNAPFIYVSTAGSTVGWVHSFSIQTSDTSGFYIDALDLLEAPEPTTMLVTGGSLLMLALLIRRKRTAAARQ